MGDKKESAFSALPSEILSAIPPEDLELLNYQEYLHRDKSAVIQEVRQNPAAVAKIYKDSMKRPGEIAVSRLRPGSGAGNGK